MQLMGLESRRVSVTYETLEIEKANLGVTWLYINNEPVNAIGDRLMTELEAVADGLEGDKSVRVIVLASRHENKFLAGAELKGLIAGISSSSDETDPIADQSSSIQTIIQ